ncbi:MAG: phage holin, LLH family [Atribacterota bacterium]|nr:phage holin, LLH family [Atribacterota bacterium]
MIQILLSKFFMEGLLVLAVSIGFGFLKNKLGNDRTETIKEALLTAMLWAEEEFGIGQGDKKWEEAWNKLQEILMDKKINLKAQEIRELKTLMKANIHRVNREYYDTLLKKESFLGPIEESSMGYKE